MPGIARTVGRAGREAPGVHAVLGLAEHVGGRLAVYGDSNCLDSSHQRTPCYALLAKLARWATEVRLWQTVKRSMQGQTPRWCACRFWAHGLLSCPCTPGLRMHRSSTQ